MAEAKRPQDEEPRPFRAPPAPESAGPQPRDPHIQSPLDMEVFRFIALTGTVLAPAAWVFGAYGIGYPWFGLPYGLLLAWLLYLVARRALVLTRDMAARAGEGEGVIDALGRNWRFFGPRGTHLGLVVIDGVGYGLSLKATRRLRPGMRVRVWYYEPSRHIIRIEETPAA